MGKCPYSAIVYGVQHIQSFFFYEFFFVLFCKFFPPITVISIYCPPGECKFVAFNGKFAEIEPLICTENCFWSAAFGVVHSAELAAAAAVVAVVVVGWVPVPPPVPPSLRSERLQQSAAAVCCTPPPPPDSEEAAAPVFFMEGNFYRKKQQQIKFRGADWHRGEKFLRI